MYRFCLLKLKVNNFRRHVRRHFGPSGIFFTFVHCKLKTFEVERFFFLGLLCWFSVFTANPFPVIKTGFPCVQILTVKTCFHQKDPVFNTGIPACSLFYPVLDCSVPLYKNYKKMPFHSLLSAYRYLQCRGQRLKARGMRIFLM